MTIQEAYNKGLDDAENSVYLNFVQWLNNTPIKPFNNPKLEDLRQRFITRFGELSKHKDQINIFDTSENTIGKIIHGILIGESPDQSMLSTPDKNICDVVRIRSDHYRSLAGGRTRTGKEFKKLVNEQTSVLTSGDEMIN